MARESAGGRVEFPHDFSRDQGETVPCCVSAAISTCLEVLYARLGPSRMLSALFHYHTAVRPQAGGLRTLSLSKGLVTAVSAGCCRLDLHDQPYTEEGALVEPSAAAVASGMEHRIWSRTRGTGREHAYVPVSSAREWPTMLSKGWPIVIGMWITDGYREMEAQDGEVHGTTLVNRADIGHAVAVLGYDGRDGSGRFIVKDSRGDRVGRRSRWLLPADLADAPDLVFEAWAVRRVVE